MAKKKTMMQLLEELTPLNRVICSTDLDRTLEVLSQQLPFEKKIYPGTQEHNGWVVPPKWDVEEATISHGGRVIYDGKAHALGVIALSSSFEGRVSSEELKRHLHFDHRYDDSLTFHFRGLFRSWQRDWGFCVTKQFFDSLKAGDYDVRIRTRESAGYIAALEYTLPGELPETIVVTATTDHPGVSNDGLSGVVTGIELFHRLAARKRKLTYRLVLPPSIMGTEYYLANLLRADKANLLETLCLFMTGSDCQLALQRSKGNRSILEALLAFRLSEGGVDHRVGDFEHININDEYIWEAHGIPACSLARFPYPAYHSSRDDAASMSERRLTEVVEVCEQALMELDAASIVRKRFDGTVCLSNPRYDLYVDPGQISFGERVDASQKKLRRLMDTIPTLDRPVTNIQLARDAQLELSVVDGYLQRWADKGLLEIK